MTPNPQRQTAKSVKIMAKGPDRRKIRKLVLSLGLDRRRVYTVGCFGELAIVGRYTSDCSGCSCDCGDGYGCSHGCAGCDECGYTGKRRTWFPEPFRANDRFYQVRPYECPGCKRPMEHFDAGCKPCSELFDRSFKPLSAQPPQSPITPEEV
jgi:hypothetical protein